MSVMYRSLIRNNNLRFFSRSCIRNETNKSVTESKKNATGSQSNPSAGFDTIAVGPVERFYLVWSGKYKSKAEVPDIVSASEYQGARTKCRIKMANYSMVIFVILAFFYSFKGKSMAKKGETFAKGSMDRHENWEKEKVEENRKSH